MRKAIDWYRSARTPWSEEWCAVKAGARHLPVIVAPTLFWHRVAQIVRNIDDAGLFVEVDRSGFRGARRFNAVLAGVAMALIAYGWPGWLLLAWAVLNLATALMLVPVLAVRHARRNCGRWPGEDPESALAKHREASRWKAATDDQLTRR